MTPVNPSSAVCAELPSPIPIEDIATVKVVYFDGIETVQSFFSATSLLAHVTLAVADPDADVVYIFKSLTKAKG